VSVGERRVSASETRGQFGCTEEWKPSPGDIGEDRADCDDLVRLQTVQTHKLSLLLVLTIQYPGITLNPHVVTP
jgi:hypothetical protein